MLHPRSVAGTVVTLGLAILIASRLASRDGDRPTPDSVPVPGREGAWKSPEVVRQARRAFTGAPPVIPHARFGAACISCHTRDGIAVEGVGFAPASPHGATPGMSEASRCQQCHVFVTRPDEFRPSRFAGVEPGSPRGSRAHPGAPPVMPHPLFMRESCLACHSGPGAREEIRTTHPERARCLQCHLEDRTDTVFGRTRLPG